MRRSETSSSVPNLNQIVDFAEEQNTMSNAITVI
jgi:hypothetical protein